MVKKLKTQLNYEDFLSELGKFFPDKEKDKDSKDKKSGSVYLTMKRLYKENCRYKHSTKCRKEREEDRKKQEGLTKEFNVLVRAKLKKKHIHTIIEPKDLTIFHYNLTKVLSLNLFSKEEKEGKEGKSKLMKKAISKTQKRKIKRLKKIQGKVDFNSTTVNASAMKVDKK